MVHTLHAGRSNGCPCDGETHVHQRHSQSHWTPTYTARGTFRRLPLRWRHPHSLTFTLTALLRRTLKHLHVLGAETHCCDVLLTMAHRSFTVRPRQSTRRLQRLHATETLTFTETHTWGNVRTSRSSTRMRFPGRPSRQNGDLYSSYGGCDCSWSLRHLPPPLPPTLRKRMTRAPATDTHKNNTRDVRSALLKMV